MKKILTLILLLIVASLSYAQEKTALSWWNPKNSENPIISGQAWSNELQSIYHRLPSRAEKEVRKEVWNLSKQSAGLSIRFWSNSPNIHVKYSVKGRFLCHICLQQE